VLLSFCGTVAVILALRGWAHRVGLVDCPSSRKTHQGHVPLVGGLAIAAGFLAAVLFTESLRLELVPLVAAIVLVVAIGVVDDLHPVSALPKLLCQVAAAVVMVVGAGLILTDFGDLWASGNVGLNGLAFPFTVFCVVGVMNAINMIDGMDGLAGGLAAVALLWLCLGAHAAGLDRGVALALILLGALGAFLLFNLPLPWRGRATVFLGDAGSLLLGFLLAWYSVDLSQNSLGKFYAISAVWILGVPILDTVYIMLRRLARGNNPFKGDRRHIHHTMIYMGFTQGQTLAMLLGLSAVFGAIGYFGWFFRVPEYVLTFGFLGVFGVYCLFMQSWKPLFRALGLRKFVPKPADGERKPGPA
jgi:UDP-GlcNAc:undecaprenyl-phosphate GlcNAc-1-phosphate transferase